MPKIWTGPSGKLIHGHVLDVSRAPLERALRAYDPLLYVRWNSKKLHGEGVWELRRHPETKSPVESVVYQGNTYTRVEYRENGLVHHVKDFPYLNYSIVEWVKDHDTWFEYGHKGKAWARELEYKEGTIADKLSDKAEEQKRYNIKQFKREIREFKEYVASGHNPYRMLDEWEKSTK